MRSAVPHGMVEARVVRESLNTWVVTYYPKFASDKNEEVVRYVDNPMPEVIRNRVAVLEMVPLDPPMPTIDGVGRRIEEDIFWVDIYGNDTGSEGEEEGGDDIERISRILFLSGHRWLWDKWHTRYRSLC